MHSSRMRKAAKIIIFFLLLLIIITLLSMAADLPNLYTRIMMHELYESDDNYDIVFMGSSRFFTGIDPLIIDEEMDANSFMLGTGAQSFIDSYYLAKEMYKYHSPDIVVLEASIHRMTEQSEDAFGERVVDTLRPSLNKLEYLIDRFEPRQWARTLFPVFRDSENLFSKEIISNIQTRLSEEYRSYDPMMVRTKVSEYQGKGFYPRPQGRAEGNMGYYNSPDKDFTINEEAVGYLKKTIDLCKGNGSDVMLVSTPLPEVTSAWVNNYQGYQDYMNEFAESEGVPFANFALLRSEIWQPEDKDFYDWTHMSWEGSEIFTSLLTDVMQQLEAGTFDSEAWFYGSIDEMLAEKDWVYAVWLDGKPENMRALSCQGSNVTPEYRFSYKPAGDEEAAFTVYREYGADADAQTALLEPGKYTLRVDARPQGSGVGYEQYDEKEIEIG